MLLLHQKLAGSKPWSSLNFTRCTIMDAFKEFLGTRNKYSVRPPHKN